MLTSKISVCGALFLPMSDIRIKQHPTLGILVCTDGHVMVPANYRSKAHWTLGSNTKDGYKTIHLNNNTYRVHRLVAETFLSNPENKPEIDHINRIPYDNRIENLRWATRSENNRNTSANDPANLKYGIHVYDVGEKEYARIRAKIYRTTDNGKASRKRYESKRSKLCKLVKFKDKTAQWLPNDIATEYLKIPKSQRELPPYILDLRKNRK